MRTQTLRAVEAILESDQGISEKQRKMFMGVLRGELSPPSAAPSDLMPQIKKLLDAITVPKTYMRRHEAAEYLGSSIRYIDEVKADGRLPFCRLGGRLIVFKREDLDKFMKETRIAIDEDE